MKVLITGATGFIGKKLLKYLDFSSITAISRVKQADYDNIEWKYFSLETLLTSGTLDGKYDVVIHLAGRAHVMNYDTIDPLAEFRKVNTAGTLNLARQAAESGVKRFVFISSIGVNGNNNIHPFTETDIPNPQEPYAVSKYEAEK
ncbi:MAG: NAD-dependent epimerase/dehydratase family protein [Methylomarinum sp.]|nr:NAD-dependent epimerase/dehydratase family protein [Methylomarinum sp.]